MATPLAVAGDAMETLKMKIFMLKKENTDVSEKMESAEKVVTKTVNDLPYIYHIYDYTQSLRDKWAIVI